MMFLKKNKETMKKGKSREKYASKETFKSAAYSNVPYKKKKNVLQHCFLLNQLFCVHSF